MSDKTPPIISAFNCHGADLRPPQGGSGNWAGDCVLCGKEHHMFVDADSGKWDCKRCGESGNLITYLTKVVDHHHNATSREMWLKLSKNRKIPVGVLKARKLGFDGEQWLIPALSHTGYVNDVRRYNWKAVMSTAGCKSQLFGMERLAKAKMGTRVWMCEGEWDAMAMDWLLREVENTTDVVVAVPGAGTLKPEWLDFFAGKHVVAVYDADEAGDRGAEKVYKALKPRAKKLEFVNWPQSRPSGYDLRDFVSQSMSETAATTVLKSLEGLRADKPRATIAKEDAASVPGAPPSGSSELPPISFGAMVKVFESQIKMNKDMIDGLRVAAAVALSNDLAGDPLWMYIVGPPGAGKTLILSAFSSTPRCLFRSTVTPHSLVSGWRGDGANDPSLIPKLKGLTFVAKDFTEILTMPLPMQEEIFSTLRGAYDGTVQKGFGNGVMREYTDCYFSILAGVTHAIHGHKKATLGERFLKFQFKPASEEHSFDVVMAAINNVGRERIVEDSLKKAMEAYLNRKIDPTDYPLMTEEYSNRLFALVQLISVLRAQVDRDVRTGDVNYRPTQEYGTRLAKQLAKLAISLCVTFEKEVVDEEVWELVEHVAYDTAYGFNYDIVHGLMELSNAATRKEISDNIRIPSSTLSRRFEDMELLRIIEKHPLQNRKPTGGGQAPTVYCVTKPIAELWYKSKGQTWTPPTPSPSPALAAQSKTFTNGSAPRRLVVSRKKKVMMKKQ